MFVLLFSNLHLPLCIFLDYFVIVFDDILARRLAVFVRKLRKDIGGLFFYHCGFGNQNGAWKGNTIGTRRIGAYDYDLMQTMK